MTGTFTWPPVMSENLCAWLAICSKTRNISDGIWNSMTGRCPDRAAPVAKLVNACSDSGVSTIRSGPKRCASALGDVGDAHPDVLAEHADAGVPLQLVAQGTGERGQIAELRHGCSLPPGA
ncbi:hypothetical protein SMD44_08322 [Streptomyces alboflavus]|uniref:Uncharacterized protein n=1 Tax=Streptomyces alboflavus TaxID=67267 RepID=A0A1Z1WQX5_9ACTN|nr:hypothetical protein SMD44_08322 [Streptomyces alboflavus]